MDIHGLCPDVLLYDEENWPRPGDGKRPLASGVLLGEAADQRCWHAESCGNSR